MVFNWYPLNIINYDGYGRGKSSGLQGLAVVSVFNAILLVAYIAFVVVDSKRLHHKRIALKDGTRSKNYEPSIELPVRDANTESLEPNASTARFVPSVKSAEGASAQHGRDFV